MFSRTFDPGFSHSSKNRERGSWPLLRYIIIDYELYIEKINRILAINKNRKFLLLQIFGYLCIPLKVRILL
jgi:hypothetical protein